jgi:hypothetical protein
MLRLIPAQVLRAERGRLVDVALRDVALRYDYRVKSTTNA